MSQPISKAGIEGAYDQTKVCEALAGGQITPLIPPGVKAVLWTDKSGDELIHPRNDSIRVINEVGLAVWK